MPQTPAGWTPIDEPKGWTPVSTAAPPFDAGDTGGVAGFAREFWKRTNPLETIKGLVHAAGDIPGTVKHLISADPAFLTQAEEAAKKGDYTTALRKVLSYASMGLGHELDTQADLMQQGRYAEGAGAMAGTAANALAPEAAGKLIGGRVIPAIAANTDPAVVRAVEAGKAAGVPIDAATASGNKFVQFAQKTADESLLGSVIGSRAQAAQQSGLATMGEQIAAKANRGAVTADQAGEAAQAGVRDTLHGHRVAADTAYAKLRAIEAQPENLRTIEPPPALGTDPRGAVQKVPMAVDLTAVKTAMQPIHARLAEQNAIVPLSSLTKEGQAFVTLDRLLKGPDVAPLSVADAALSDLKTMARAKNPDLRTAGQGIAAKATQELHRAVMDAATAAGPDAVAALNEGRTATIAKASAADVLKKLSGATEGRSPVEAFRAITRDADASVGRLKDVLTTAPASKPLIGRAVLDGVIDSPTVTPGRALTDWQKIGPDTKALLYTPEHIRAVDDFLLLRKKIAENPNPSGSGLTLLKGGELVLRNPELTIGLPVLSALVHSPIGARLLTQGFRLPSQSAIARSAWAAQVLKAADAAGIAMQPATGR